MSIGLPELTIGVVVCIALLAIVWPASRICARLGYPPLIGLLAVVPGVNVGLLWFVALAGWPRDATRRA